MSSRTLEAHIKVLLMDKLKIQATLQDERAIAIYSSLRHQFKGLALEKALLKLAEDAELLKLFSKKEDIDKITTIVENVKQQERKIETAKENIAAKINEQEHKPEATKEDIDSNSKQVIKVEWQ